MKPTFTIIAGNNPADHVGIAAVKRLTDASIPKLDTTDAWADYIDSICQRIGVTDSETRRQIDYHELLHLVIVRDNIDAAYRLLRDYGVDLTDRFGR